MFVQDVGLLNVKFKQRVDSESSGKAGLFHRMQNKDKWVKNFWLNYQASYVKETYVRKFFLEL